MRLAYIIIVVFSFLVANLPLPIYSDAENPSIYFNISESSNRNCDDCEYDWSDYGSQCCDTAWIEYGVNCEELESNYFWDCSGCSCPGDEDEESCEGEWIENIESGNCSNYNNSWSCDGNSECYWDLCYGGSYGSWSSCCIGGAYQVDNGYCEEIEFQLGDINSDSFVNVLDIIEVVNLILAAGYNEVVDMNQDGRVDILDIVIIVEIIISN